MLCPQCGADVGNSLRLCASCAASSSRTGQGVREAPDSRSGISSVRTSQVRYASQSALGVISSAGTAGFWLRFFATALDYAFLMILTFVLTELAFPHIGVGLRALFENIASGLITSPSLQITALDLKNYKVMDAIKVVVLYFGTGLIYFPIFECLPGRATPGKVAMGIYVCTPEDDAASFFRTLLRHICKVFSAFTFCVGFLMAAFGTKRALHDILSLTFVARSPVVSSFRRFFVALFSLFFVWLVHSHSERPVRHANNSQSVVQQVATITESSAEQPTAHNITPASPPATAAQPVAIPAKPAPSVAVEPLPKTADIKPIPAKELLAGRLGELKREPKPTLTETVPSLTEPLDSKPVAKEMLAKMTDDPANQKPSGESVDEALGDSPAEDLLREPEKQPEKIPFNPRVLALQSAVAGKSTVVFESSIAILNSNGNAGQQLSVAFFRAPLSINQRAKLRSAPSLTAVSQLNSNNLPVPDLVLTLVFSSDATRCSASYLKNAYIEFINNSGGFQLAGGVAKRTIQLVQSSSRGFVEQSALSCSLQDGGRISAQFLGVTDADTEQTEKLFAWHLRVNAEMLVADVGPST